MLFVSRAVGASLNAPCHATTCPALATHPTGRGTLVLSWLTESCSGHAPHQVVLGRSTTFVDSATWDAGIHPAHAGSAAGGSGRTRLRSWFAPSMPHPWRPWWCSSTGWRSSAAVTAANGCPWRHSRLRLEPWYRGSGWDRWGWLGRRRACKTHKSNLTTEPHVHGACGGGQVHARGARASPSGHADGKRVK